MNENDHTDPALYTINGVPCRFHPELGYNEAEKWLREIGEWDYVSTHGFSTDGWSIIATANAMWNQRNPKLATSDHSNSET